MAKMSDLKKLVDAAQAKAPCIAPTLAPKSPAAPPPKKRVAGVATHAEGAFDLAEAFADVRKMPPSTRARHAPQRPAPIARQRIADDADALTASKYGSELAPENWEIGQEHEAEQTFLRRGLSPDILKKLRRGEWAVQGRVRKWLSHWDEVLAYCEAPQNAGGGGAVLVLLRGTVRGG